MFCRYCGTQLSEDARFCTQCGKPTSDTVSNEAQENSSPMHKAALMALVVKFSERMKINAIIWIVIAALQIILGLFVDWTFLIVGVLNLISSIIDFNYAKKVLTSPCGIVEHEKPLVGPIITLIYNLVFGGVIGIAGSIYYLVAVRGFVMENASAFNALENEN